MYSRSSMGNARRRSLALAVATALGLVATGAMAQSTVGSVYGTADAGAQVTIVNTGSGLTRNVTVGNDGKFSVSSLQPGDYRISATEKGQTTTRTVEVVAGQGFNLNLAAPAAAAGGTEDLSTVSVTANALPPIDITSSQTNTVLTSEQIKQLPLARNQTAVALLAPGATKGDSAFGNLASFSGASVAENSYYVNGFNVTNFFQSLTYSQVPFEAIDQEEIQDGGYGAEYGNSTGGVISVNTKRGTNEWKGGVDVTWNPYQLQASQPDIYLKNGSLLRTSSSNKNYLIGNNNSGNANDFGTRYNAWIGGPLIKDKLFMFALVGGTRTNDEHYGDTTGGGNYNRTSISDPRYLVKLDWNISDSNILEYTGFSDTSKTNQSIYGYGYSDNGQPYRTDYLGNVYNKTGGQTNILKYTSYITDDFTISAQYGKSVNKRVNTATAANGIVETYDGNIFDAANSPGCPSITDNRTPVQNGAQGYNHCDFAGSLNTPNGEDRRGAGRIDFEYKLGDHDLKAGWARDHFTSQTGTSYEGGALYTYSSIPASLLGHDPGLDPSDSIVRQTVFATGAKIGVTQKSYYLQDNWHITDNFTARIGVRNDGFENTNSEGATYVKQVHSWQPRLGFSWDVHGDSTLKIYGSAGDYSLPLDANVALRGASASLYQIKYFSYTGVDPLTGAPTGLGALPAAYAAAFPSRTGTVYANGESGTVPDPGAVATQNLKPFKQREFILGAQQQVGDWTLGVKGIYRFILTGVDDACDFRPIAAYANSTYGLNLDTTSLTPEASNVPGCYIFNPGSGVTLNTPLDATGKLYSVHLTADQVGEPKYKRSYEALQLTAERNFDNVWYLKASYVWSHTRGNAEGGVDSSNGQADTGTTELFDYPEIMAGSNGYLPNDREHTVKVYGAWQINPEWMVGANAIFQTGRPENCYGLNPIDSQVVGGYGSGAYLYCNGVVVDRGSVGRTPNYWNIDLNAAYKPEWAKGLTLSANVFNVFNKQKALSVNEVGEDANGVSLSGSTYLTPTSFQQPRYVQVSAEYDFTL
ncbi:TonB-dependent receptor-like protein [Luteibacter rhizovicinus]|uniref:TonB-dependent receptor-like protein n=1 Tax=Luteibacter rhizovicinus TaxID=242606 RepID=A0A4R3YJB9_9GAMM|nr:TonB-dependent receptor [Luteibacter rhizovicinus]TCV92326.1 TonB-dependent receptor-like protein [Luteibacter rhizovicinus]